MLNEALLQELARNRGFETIEHLLTELYVTMQKPLSEIALELHLSAYTSRQLLLRSGISLRPKVVKMPDISMRELKGLTIGQLSKKHGISKSKAWRLRKAAKLLKKATHKPLDGGSSAGASTDVPSL